MREGAVVCNDERGNHSCVRLRVVLISKYYDCDKFIFCEIG